MAGSNKCGVWGDFIAGDHVRYAGKRAKIVLAYFADVPTGYAPIELEDSPGAFFSVPREKLSRIRASTSNP